MKPNIVFLDEYSLCGGNLEKIQAMGNYTGYEKTRPEEVAERIAEAEIVITNKVVLNAETIARAKNLRLICVAATGMNNIDFEATDARGIEVRNAVGYSTHSVTETTIGAAIALLRQSVYYDRYVKSGAYAASDVPFFFGRPTHRLHGKRWGIIGLGTIGHRVAEVATALGCEVCYASTSGVVREEPYTLLPMEELLRTSDIVSIHSPLNDRTWGLLDAERIALMKPTAVVINVARGGIIDERALAEALDGGRLAGAAVDVFPHEPIAADNPLLHLADPDKVLLSPHNAWSPVESIEVLIGCIERNIEEYLTI